VELLPRCATLARGYALLRGDPSSAREIAEALQQDWTVSSAPALLEAQALVRLGRFGEAWKRFEAARAVDPAAPRSPPALRALATAAARTDHLVEARAALAALLPRVALLAAPADAVRVHVEAATLAMLEGPASLDEAIAYLMTAREARTAPELDEIVVAALALALDRADRTEEAAAVLQSASGPWRLEALVDPDEPASQRFQLPFLPAGEVHALIALLAEPADRELAALHWEQFVEERGSGAFVEHARHHLHRRGRR
jgi:hypothetical protein